MSPHWSCGAQIGTSQPSNYAAAAALRIESEGLTEEGIGVWHKLVMYRHKGVTRKDVVGLLERDFEGSRMSFDVLREGRH